MKDVVKKYPKVKEFHICYIYDGKKISKNVKDKDFQAALEKFTRLYKFDIIAQITDRSDFSMYKLA